MVAEAPQQNGTAPPPPEIPAALARALALPPRVCFGVMKPVNNPVCSLNEVVTACGQPARESIDRIVFDLKEVKCDACRAVIAMTPPGQNIQARPSPAVAVPSPPPGRKRPGGGLGTVIEGLDVLEIESRLKELRGEEAALKVLMKAAKAKDKARQEPVAEK